MSFRYLDLAKEALEPLGGGFLGVVDIQEDITRFCLLILLFIHLCLDGPISLIEGFQAMSSIVLKGMARATLVRLNTPPQRINKQHTS